MWVFGGVYKRTWDGHALFFEKTKTGTDGK
jgi:hypothetical protein